MTDPTSEFLFECEFPTNYEMENVNVSVHAIRDRGIIETETLRLRDSGALQVQKGVESLDSEAARLRPSGWNGRLCNVYSSCLNSARNPRFKTGNLWTGQNRQLRAAETSEFYFVPSSVRKIGLHLGPPAPWSAFEHVRVM
jgi:hypothetical protein